MTRRTSLEALLSSLSSEPVVKPLMVGAGIAALASIVLDLTVDTAQNAWLVRVLSLVAIATALASTIALRRRMRIVSEALDATKAPFVVYDENDRFVICNERYREILQLPGNVLLPGLHYQDIVRRSLGNSVPPDLVEHEVARRFAVQRESSGIPTDRRYPNGKWMRVTKARTRSGASVGIAIDVSELYTLKAKLQAEVQRFTALGNSAPVGICEVSRDLDVRFVNAVLLDMLGVPDTASLFADAMVFVAGGQRWNGFAALLAYLGADNNPRDLEIRLPEERRTFLLKKAVVEFPAIDGPAIEGVDDRELILIFVDITDRKQAEERIRYLALHDTLTGAGNRAAFLKSIASAAEDVAETSPLTLIAIDLDRFKPVNDTYGHAAGDAVLKQIVERMRALLAPSMSLYRMGGDEFTIICRPDGMPSRESFARALLARLEEPFRLGEHEISLSASIGISVMPADTDDARTLLHYADLASYRAKHSGGGRICSFHEGLLDSVDTGRMLEFELKDALERETFEIVYQPQFALAGGVPVGVEAFVRWRRKRSGALLKPAEFIAAAKRLEIVDKLDLIVLQRTVAAYGVALGEPRCPRTLAVNVAGATLARADIVSRIDDILARNAVPPERLILELSEPDAACATDRLVANVGELSERGVRLMLDEFGSGSASLKLLTRFPLCGIKVDCRLACNEAMRSITGVEILARPLVDIARRMDIAIVASGVECEDGLNRLAGYGYGIFQGHLFGPVGPAIPTDLCAAPISAGPGTPLLPGFEEPPRAIPFARQA